MSPKPRNITLNDDSVRLLDVRPALQVSDIIRPKTFVSHIPLYRFSISQRMASTHSNLSSKDLTSEHSKAIKRAQALPDRPHHPGPERVRAERRPGPRGAEDGGCQQL